MYEAELFPYNVVNIKAERSAGMQYAENRHHKGGKRL